MVYQESYNETSFPMTPEIDFIGLGAFNAGTGGQGPPPVPVPTGSAAFVTATSTGGGLPDEIPGTGVLADQLLALGIPYTVTGRYENFSVTASRTDPGGVLGVGGVATALFDVPGGYAISASIFAADPGVAPSLNIAEIYAGTTLVADSLLLPASFDSSAFDLQLVVDPVAGTALARVSSGGQTFETAPISLTSYAGRQNMTLGQLLIAANQYGPGDTTSAEFADFKIDAPWGEPIAVTIDVLPGDRQNVIDPRQELTPVAIFSTSDFDATTIVPSSISLGGAPVGVSPKLGERCRIALVNRDRRPDLLCRVVTALIDVPIGRSVVTLHGTTADGTPVEGRDIIRRLK